jgi:hypothetical protein
MKVKKSHILFFLLALLPIVLVVPLIIGSGNPSLSQHADIVVNGNLSDWAGLDSVSDSVGDASTGYADDELLVSAGDSNTLMVFDYQSGSMVNIFNITTTGSVRRAEVGDVDNDGKAEIVVGTDNGGNDLIQFFRDVSGTWANYYNRSFDCAIAIFLLEIEDVDNDGNLEIIGGCGDFIGQGKGKLEILENASGTMIVEKTITNLPNNPWAGLEVGNLDNDDYKEIFIADEANTQIIVYEYNGSDYVNTANIDYVGDMAVMDDMDVGDADGDGVDDLLTCGSDDQLRLFSATGDDSYQNVWSSTDFDGGTGVQACGIGDFNGNGKPDLVGGDVNYQKKLEFYEKDNAYPNNFTYSNTWNYTYTGDGANIACGVALDLDSDGRDEWALGDDASKYFNNDTSPYGPPFTVTTVTSLEPMAMGAGDVDNDGGTGGVSNNNFDMKTVSVANNDSYLFGYVEVNGSITSSQEYYRFFINTDNTGSGQTPEGENLPFNYNYRVEVKNSQCDIYNSSEVDVGNCSQASSAGELEVGVLLSDLGVSLNDDLNISFETGNSSLRYDLAPNYADFILYHVNDGSQCGDSYCNGTAGENCSSCAIDCISGEFATCGDDVCHGQAEGEDCNSCSSDCFGETYTPGTCEACFKGKCDGSCHPTKEDETCQDCNTPVTTCCGDEVCEGNENSSNCPVDCGTVGPLDTYCCGDDVCEGDENVTNCATDCNCKVDGDCDDGNECTYGVCTTPFCDYFPVPDETPCFLGGEICCTGVCLSALCDTGLDCGDGNECTTDSCSNGCINGDGCCPSGCDSGNDDDCVVVDCSACHKGVCDGSCNPRKDGPGCPDCA